MVALRIVVVIVVASACGGSKPALQAPPPKIAKAPPPPAETEVEREHARHALATAIVPDGSTCLPSALRAEGAPRLELAAAGKDVIVCAVDTDETRLLGPVGCWKVDVASAAAGGLTYQPPAPLPGHDVDVLLEQRCVRGYCMPKDVDLGDAKIAHMSWNADSTKVAVLLGDNVHLFDAGTKAHESSFSVRGDKGVVGDPVAIYFAGAAVFVASSSVWMFKLDGTAGGSINALGGKDVKPLSTLHGGVSVIDPKQVAIAEHGMDTFTTYEIATGKRTKAVRKPVKTSCKAAEVDAFWNDGDKVTDKCKTSMMKASGALMGASVVMGKDNLLVLLRNDRLGELAVLDPHSLVEKKTIKMQWCQ